MSVSGSMASRKIDIQKLKSAVTVILDHISDDLNIHTFEIKEEDDFYWTIPEKSLYDTKQPPVELEAGRLSDDVGFAEIVSRGNSADVAYNLVHVTPLLRYLGDRIKS